MSEISLFTRSLTVWLTLNMKYVQSLSLSQDSAWWSNARRTAHVYIRFFPMRGLVWEYLSRNGHIDSMDILDWPPYSPDLNPIENIWSWLKVQVSREIPQNIDELIKIIKKHWDRITPAMLKPYIDGMEDIFKAVISNRGRYINK